MPDSGIRLKNICTNVVTSDLLSYLASYSGLEKLAFERPDGRDRADADQLADIFFGSVLPRHVKSLVEMSCPAGYDSRWSFGTHNVDLVSELHSVTSLEMSVDFGHWVDHRPSMASVVLRPSHCYTVHTDRVHSKIF
ncbi:hypothetical protein C8R44DRAFT_645124 [Mycena epipterygia]|nr:hypothetical protein C8R44DRAFT_645124 [Mycena epipterygia]